MLKICIACSAGGHLTEMLQLRESYEKFDHFYLTFKRNNSLELSREQKVFFIEDPERNFFSLAKCICQSFSILLKEKPNALISNGAGVAVPACYIAKFILRAKIAFIESFCRVCRPSLSGRLVFPVSDLFLVQWERILEKYGRKAVYRGSVV